MMRSLIAIIVPISLVACGPSQEEIDNTAIITCNIMAESRNMDAAMRIKEINVAREKIGEAPYLGNDDGIKVSFTYGLCEELVKNDPTYRSQLAEERAAAESWERELRRVAAEAEAEKEAERRRIAEEEEAERRRIAEEQRRIAEEKEERLRIYREKKAAEDKRIRAEKLAAIKAKYEAFGWDCPMPEDEYSLIVRDALAAGDSALYQAATACYKEEPIK